MNIARQHSWAFPLALMSGQMAVMIGLAAMFAFGAPPILVVINAISLVLVTGLALLLRRWRASGIDQWIVAATLILLISTLAIGPDLSGIRRWLAVGPIRLHIAMLLVPSLAVAVTRIDARRATGALCLAATITAFQPDLATALALLAIASVAAGSFGTSIRWVAVLAAAGSVLWCLTHPIDLAPVRFVEHVLVDMASANIPLAFAMAAVSLAAIAGPFIGWTREDRVNRAAKAAFAASLGAFLCASVIGPYPTPLLGGGAAAILGWGLGLGYLFAPVGTSPPSG